MILDQYGHQVDLNALREPQSSRVGYLKREFDQHPARGLTPARLQGILGQAELGNLVDQLELADDMEERDGHIYAELFKRKGAVSALEWDIHAPDKASAAEESLAAEVRDWLQGLPELADVLFGMMDGVLKGFAMHELVWSPEPGLGRKVLSPSFTFRPQRWFTVDEDRSMLMLRSAGGGSMRALAGAAEPLQPFGWLAHQHHARSGYVTRNSLARVLAWPYLFKNYAVRDLAEFLEIFGLPLRLGKYPAGASDTEKATLLQAVVNIGHNAAGIIPQGMAIDFQKAADGSAVPFAAMWDRMEAIESRVILGQTLTAGEGQTGTQALGTIHNEVRMDIRNADARQVEQTLNNQLIRAYCLINHAGVAPHRLPRFAFDTGEGEDLQLYAENLPKLAAAGLRIGVGWAHKKLRIPEAEEGEELLRAAAADGSVLDVQPNKPKLPPAPEALAAKPGAGAPPRDAIDDLVDAELAHWRPMLAPMVQPLLAELENALAAGESLAAFAERLPALAQRMDAAPMAERLARAAFSARLAGEAQLDLET
jgi:phage gp29-like protein